MKRYTESRLKFPIHVDLGLTDELAAHADAIAERRGLFHHYRGRRIPNRSEGIRRAIHIAFLLDNSADRTPPTE